MEHTNKTKEDLVKELKELNFKSKGLKEEKLKSDAAEYDKLKKKKIKFVFKLIKSNLF